MNKQQKRILIGIGALVVAFVGYKLIKKKKPTAALTEEGEDQAPTGGGGGGGGYTPPSGDGTPPASPTGNGGETTPTGNDGGSVPPISDPLAPTGGGVTAIPESQPRTVSELREVQRKRYLAQQPDPVSQTLSPFDAMEEEMSAACGCGI